ncbi:MAG: ABC transporter substrate-binding protein, partial [Burkholderiaceae bacterium]
TLVPELSAKQFALLSEMVPGLARVAIFGDSGEAGDAHSVAEAERAAAKFFVQSQTLDLRKVGDPAQLFAAAAGGRAGAVLVLASGYLFARQDEVVSLALKARLPAIYAHPEFVRRGGLATYGVNVLDLFRRSAGYVVKILNGTKPADLPIEQPTKIEFVINLKTAKAIGLSIPQSLLLRADEVIQ